MEKKKDRSHSVLSGMFSSQAGLIISRISGLLRDCVGAAYWGATEVLQGAYTNAFAIPNAMRRLFAEGIFSSAFVPVFSKKLSQDTQENAWRFACRIVSTQMIALAASVVLGWIVVAVSLFSARFFPMSRLALTTWQLLPILLPYMFLVCVTAAFAAILNTLRVYALPAMSQAIFNGVQILMIGVLTLLHFTNTQYFSVLMYCFSTLLGGVLQMALMMWLCRRRGFRFRFEVFPFWKDQEIMDTFKRYGQGLVGSGVQVLNSFVDRVLGNWLGAAAVGALNYSNRIVQLPTALIGSAIGTASLPEMSRMSEEERSACLDETFRHAVFLVMPVTLLAMVLMRPIVVVLFQRGAFTDEAVTECLWALLFYLPGVPAFCVARVFANVHNAQQDMRTPMVFSVICMAVNLVMNLILMQFMRQGGLALSTTLSSTLNLVLLMRSAARCSPSWQPQASFRSCAKILLAGVVAAAFTYVAYRWTGDALADMALTRFWRAAALLAGPGGVGCVVYVAMCVMLRCPELADFRDTLMRKLRRG